MIYMGSKRQYCKYIVPIIQKYIDENTIDMFIDCFVGGGNLVDKINCKNVYANDLSPTLIALHQLAQKDFSAIPQEGNREYWDKAYAEWKKMKQQMDNKEEINVNMPLAEIGAIEWYASYSRGGFHKGYVKEHIDKSTGRLRNPYKEAYSNHFKQANTENYKKIHFIQGDYRDIFNKIDIEGYNILLYCDSPYASTTPYAISKNWNSNEYYTWLKETKEKYPIFVSEQTLPEEFGEPIWEKETNRTTSKNNKFKATEKLWLLN